MRFHQEGWEREKFSIRSRDSSAVIAPFSGLKPPTPSCLASILQGLNSALALCEILPATKVAAHRLHCRFWGCDFSRVWASKSIRACYRQEKETAASYEVEFHSRMCLVLIAFRFDYQYACTPYLSSILGSTSSRFCTSLSLSSMRLKPYFL